MVGHSNVKSVTKSYVHGVFHVHIGFCKLTNQQSCMLIVFICLRLLLDSFLKTYDNKNGIVKDSRSKMDPVWFKMY